MMGPPPEVNEHDPVPKEAFTKGENLIEEVWPKPLTVKERYDIFMNETSFTALTRIHKANSIVKRVTWMIVVLGMFAWLGCQCFWLFEKYFNYPVEVKVELLSVTKLDFPSVTICNRNPLRKSTVRHGAFEAIKNHLEVKDNDALYDRAKESMSDDDDNDSGEKHGDTKHPKTTPKPMTMEEKMKANNYNVWDMLKDANASKSFYNSMDKECSRMLAYSSFAATLPEEELKYYGHNSTQMLLSCKFNGYPCSPENFTYVHNSKFGNCYTFNHFKNGHPPLSLSYAGPLMGLVMEMNIEQEEYIAALSSDAGVRILIHPYRSYPFPEDEGVAVAPGFITSIGLKQITIGRLPPPHAGCANHGKNMDYYRLKHGVSYSKISCLKSCYQDKFLENCGCAVPFYILPDNKTMCDTGNSTQLDCIANSNTLLSKCDEDCPAPCEERKYEPMIYTAMWPSEPYEDYLEDRLKKTNAKFLDKEKLKDLDDNLVKIEVYFRELMYDSITQQKAYESQNLISDVGGQLGLWLGLSAITIGEFVEFFAAVFKAVTARAVKRSHVNNEETPVQTFRG